MVGKLLKYEFKYYFRIMIFYIPIIILLGILSRLTQFLNFNIQDKYGLIETFYSTIMASSSMMMIFTSVASLLFTTILGVVRFYKNLYSSDGYLTFTIPVSNCKLLFTKLFSFIVCQLITLLAILIAWSIFIFTSKEFIKVASDFIKNILSNHSFIELIKFVFDEITFHLVLYFIEYIVLMSIALIVNTLVYYTCMTIGQLVNKGRIILSIGVYYGYNWITQAIGNTIYYSFYMFLVFGALSMPIELRNLIETAFVQNIEWWIHILFIGTTIVAIGFGCLLYFINLFIMNKKLNLE